MNQDTSEYSINLEDIWDVWDQLMFNHSEPSCFHLSSWFPASKHQKALYIIRDKKGRVVSGLPLCKEKLFGLKVGHRPRGAPYGGPIILHTGDISYTKRLSREKAINYLYADRLKRDFDYINFPFYPGLKDLQVYQWANYNVKVRYTYEMPFLDLDVCWRSMGYKNHINKAIKDGCHVKIGTDPSPTEQMMEISFKRQNKRFKMSDNLRENIKKSEGCGRTKTIGVYSKEGDLLASSTLLSDKVRAYYLLGGYDYKNAHRGAGPLSLWEAMKAAKESLGVKSFDFEGSSIPGVEQYFRKFGATLSPIFEVSYSSPAASIANYFRKKVRS